MEKDLFDQLYDFLEEKGPPNGCALEARHLRKMVPDSYKNYGSHITFSVDRHPSCFGRSTKGLPSDAYATFRETYSFDGEKIDFIDSEYLGTRWDIDLMVGYEFAELTSDFPLSEAMDNIIPGNVEKMEQYIRDIGWFDTLFEIAEYLPSEQLCQIQEEFYPKIAKRCFEYLRKGG